MTIAQYLLRHDPDVLAELVERDLIDIETLHDIILGDTPTPVLMNHDRYVRQNGAIVQTGWGGESV